jgi:hypothetical protein
MEIGVISLLRIRGFFTKNKPVRQKTGGFNLKNNYF